MTERSIKNNMKYFIKSKIQSLQKAIESEHDNLIIFNKTKNNSYIDTKTGKEYKDISQFSTVIVNDIPKSKKFQEKAIQKIYKQYKASLFLKPEEVTS